MATEKGQNVLLFIGDGGSVQATGAIFSIVGSGNVIHRTSGSYVLDGFEVGMLVHVTGYDDEDVPAEFHGIVASFDADDLTLTSVVDADGNPLTLVDLAAGDSVLIVGEEFNVLKGQDDTQEQVAASSIDASTKDTGNWGASLAGTNRQTVTVTGKVNWPDVLGVQRVLDEMEDQGLAWLKLKLNIAGWYYWGEYAITNKQVGGAKDGATTYSITFENKRRPNLVKPPV